MLFAAHGTDHYNWDNNTMFLLPEYLHRLQFPQRRRMENSSLPPPTIGKDWWVHAAWTASFGDERPRPAFDQGINWVPATGMFQIGRKCGLLHYRAWTKA